MHASARDTGDADFGAYLHHRGQDTLRLGYLLTGDPDAARSLAVHSLGELGARWRALTSEHGDPEVAARVLTAARFLRSPTTTPQPAGARPESVDAGWAELCAREPIVRANLVLQHWAELGADALDRAVAPPRTGLRASLRRWRPRLHGAWERLTDQPLDADRALIDVQRPMSHRCDRLTGRYLQDVFRHAERSTPTLDEDFVNDVIARATGRRQQLQRRHRVVAAAAALIVSVAGGASALTPEPAPPPKAAGAAAGAHLTWADAWPNTRITRFAAELEDGRPYRPLRFVDLRTALAVTVGPTPPAQLVLVDLDSRTAQPLGAVAEPVDEIATATDGFHVSWISTRRGDTELWIADVNRRSPRLVTTLPPLSPRAHPWALGMGAGRLYLVRRGAEHRTVEILSIRHTGGGLRTDLTLPGYVPVGWPWFSTVARSAHQDVQIRNALTGDERVGRLPRGSELGVCDGMWCVGTRRSDGGPTGGDVLVGQLDGSHRTSVVLTHSNIGPLPVLAGRFVLIRTQDQATYLHDLRQDQQIRLAGTVRDVVPSGRYFGWSVGTPHGSRWRLADLAPLP